MHPFLTFLTLWIDFLRIVRVGIWVNLGPYIPLNYYLLLIVCHEKLRAKKMPSQLEDKRCNM